MGKEVAKIVIPCLDEMFNTLSQFVKDASYFATKCKKPDKTSMTLQCRVIGTAFFAIGFLGFFVRLMSLPLMKFLVNS